MATNPMQRKARNSFLLGMLLMLVIAGTVIGILFVQLKNYKDKEKAELQASVKVWVLNSDVSSGQVITTDMLKQQTVNRNFVPTNATGDLAILNNYALQDKEGNNVTTEYKNNEARLYITRNNKKAELKQEEATGSYYVDNSGADNGKEYIDLVEAPLVAKVDMYKNTVITTDMIAKGDNTTTDDVRKQEYNMITLPSQIATGDYIDIRLALPSGQDYIVVAKKEVQIPEIGGIPSEDTIWVNLSEEEILTMNNAIVEAWRTGSKLYANTYTEAGMQTAAIPTYSVSKEVYTLILSNPNVVEQAKKELNKRYNVEQRNGPLNSAISNSGEEGADNLKTKMEESGSNSKDTRKKFLDSMAGIEK